MHMVFGYIAIAMVGVTLGLVGAGGSILTVPVMVYLFGYSSGEATGYSLGVVGATALVALIKYWRQGKVNVRVAIKFVPASIAGVIVARQLLVPALPARIALSQGLELTKDNLIMLAFAVVMVLAAKSMISPNSSPSPGKSMTSRSAPMELFIALATGVITGFVGAGGGFLIIPVLVSVIGLEMPVAVGTSLMIIAINSISGFISAATSSGDTPWMDLTSMIAVSSAGAVQSANWAGKVPQAKLKTGFGWFVLAMGCVIIAEQLY